jgi:hypothetical protein
VRHCTLGIPTSISSSGPIVTTHSGGSCALSPVTHNFATGRMGFTPRSPLTTPSAVPVSPTTGGTTGSLGGEVPQTWSWYTGAISTRIFAPGGLLKHLSKKRHIFGGIQRNLHSMFSLGALKKLWIWKNDGCGRGGGASLNRIVHRPHKLNHGSGNRGFTVLTTNVMYFDHQKLRGKIKTHI